MIVSPLILPRCAPLVHSTLSCMNFCSLCDWLFGSARNAASANVLFSLILHYYYYFVLHMRTFTVHSHRQLVKQVLECRWAKVWKSHRHLCHPRVHMHFMQLHKMYFQRNFDIFSFGFSLLFLLVFLLHFLSIWIHTIYILSWSEWVWVACCYLLYASMHEMHSVCVRLRSGVTITCIYW